MRHGRQPKPFATRAIILTCALFSVAPAGRGAELDLRTMFREGIPPSPFASVFYRYADAMLEHGRDTYGPRKTGLLLSALDRETLLPLKTRPTAPHAATARPGPPGGPLVGASPPMDQNVLRLLYFLVGLSGEDRYAQAADEGLRAFLKDPAWEDAGMLPWGKHTFWNVMTDQVACSAEAPSDELFGPWVLWETCFRLAPEESRRIAAGMRDSALLDQAADVAAGRRGFSGRRGSATISARQQGFLIRTWAEAYAHTGDGTFLEAIEALLAPAEGSSHPAEAAVESGAAANRVGPALSLAIDCDGAARKVPEPLRTRLAGFAARQDRIFCSLPHALQQPGGFVVGAGRPAAGTAGAYTSLWKKRPGQSTTAAMAMMCVSRYENTGKIGYRELIVAAADAYLDSLPDGQTDAWPMTFGHVISLELAAFRITADRKYYQRAFALGELAVKEFFGESPLPRASLKTDHYESATGAGSLVLALADLHLSTLHITAVRVPDNTIDR
jgi:hypothetical protein